MPKAPELSVVICTLNRAQLLDLCLAGLQVQTLDAELFEIIVIDNGSSDNTSEVVSRYSGNFYNFRLLHEAKKGLSHARNLGWRSARGRLIAYLDDDAIASPEWCERILGAFIELTPSPDAVGGKILPWTDQAAPWWYAESLETRTWGDSPRRLSDIEAKVGFSGSNMAFLREVLECFGGFDPAYGVGGRVVSVGEDTEMFNRLALQGKSFWYEPAAVVRHYASPGCLNMRLRLRRWYRNGKCRGMLEKCKVNWVSQVWAWIKIPLYVGFVGPLKLALRCWGDRTMIVRVLQEAAFLAGKAMSGKKL